MKRKGFELTVFLFVVSLIPFIGCTVKREKAEQIKQKPCYVFEIDHEVKRTPVKDQGNTATCWSFATISFLESEFLRSGGEEIDLSEMFVVRYTYPHKALNYIKAHGDAKFGQGGQAHDVIDQFRRHGIVPERVYPGKGNKEDEYDHGEMFSVLKSILKQGELKSSPEWIRAFEAVLDVYLGKATETFSYKGKEYTPKSFLNDFLQLNMDDYIELTSYTRYPFYKKCRLEIPDNYYGNDNYYNVPIDDMERIVDHALKTGFSVVWDGGIRETDAVKEKEITQEMRQETFDNGTTTDDHLMHIVGITHDQKGTKCYLTKDSYPIHNKNKGYVYLSKSYFRLKTVALMINKHALSANIAQKLNLIE